MKSRTKSTKDNLTMDSSKSRKKSTEGKSNPKIHNSSIIKGTTSQQQKHEKQQAKKYLQKTLNILSNRFKVKITQKQKNSNMSNLLNLSTSVYKIVKQNLPVNNLNNISSSKALKATVQQNYHTNKNIPTNPSKIRDQIQNQFMSSKLSSDTNRNSRKVIVSEKQNCKQRANSALTNYSILDVSSIGPQNNVIPPEINGFKEKRRSNSTLDNYFREKFGTTVDDEQAVQKKLRVIKALKKSQEIVNKSNRSHAQNSIMLSNCDINDKSVVIEKLKNKRI